MFSLAATYHQAVNANLFVASFFRCECFAAVGEDVGKSRNVFERSNEAFVELRALPFSVLCISMRFCFPFPIFKLTFKTVHYLTEKDMTTPSPSIISIPSISSFILSLDQRGAQVAIWGRSTDSGEGRGQKFTWLGDIGTDFEMFRRTIHKNIYIADNVAKNYFMGGAASKMPLPV